MLERLLHKILYKLGWHHFSRTNIIANLCGLQLQGGDKCYYCGHQTITTKEAGDKAEYAYQRGKQDLYIAMTAYNGKYFNAEDHGVIPRRP